MTATNNNCLGKFLDENCKDKRFVNWLYGWMITHLGLAPTINLHSTNESDFRDYLLSELKKRHVTTSDITAATSKMLIDEKTFEWFEDSKRFHNWFKKRFHSHFFANTSKALPINHRESCILAIDSSSSDIQSKIGYLLAAKESWKNKKEIGSHFDWIHNQSNLQASIHRACLCAREFNQEVVMIEPPESIEELLIVIDALSLSEHEAKNASANARRKISQEKYRNESKNKKQLNVFIDKKAITALEQICQKHELSKAKAIEILINTEKEKNIYITEKKAAWLNGKFD